MRARMATITYHAPYNQHTIATRNQGDNVSSMLPILGSGDDSCSALETACGHKRALRGHKPQPLTAKTHLPPAQWLGAIAADHPRSANLQELVISRCWCLLTHPHTPRRLFEHQSSTPATQHRWPPHPVPLTIKAHPRGQLLSYLPGRLHKTAGGAELDVCAGSPINSGHPSER